MDTPNSSWPYEIYNGHVENVWDIPFPKRIECRNKFHWLLQAKSYLIDLTWLTNLILDYKSMNWTSPLDLQNWFLNYKSMNWIELNWLTQSHTLTYEIDSWKTTTSQDLTYKFDFWTASQWIWSLDYKFDKVNEYKLIDYKIEIDYDLVWRSWLTLWPQIERITKLIDSGELQLYRYLNKIK
jgi:hypothetical protein